MKTTTVTIVSFLFGLVIGCGLGFRFYDRFITNKAVQQSVEAGESSAALLAATSTRAIGFIDSGDSQKAVELLSRPIGSYYFLYGTSTFTNEQRLKLRAMIDKLASTNQIVAAEIANRTSSR